MTISTQASSVTVAGNGSTVAFNFSFIAGTASNIVVTYVNSAGTAAVLSSSQYTLVINAPVAGQLWGVGGTVTYPISGSPIAAGTSITIQRLLPLTQVVSISNQGDFYPDVVERALDTLCMELQQVATSSALALQLNPTSVGISGILPPTEQLAGQLLGFNNLGQPIAAQPTGTLVSAAMQPVVGASTTGAALTLLGGASASNVLPLSGGTLTGTLIAPAISDTGAQTLVVAPTANPSISTLASLSVQGSAISATTREFMTSLGMTSSLGSGASGGNGDKVTLYAGMDAHDGSGDVWAFNTVTTMNAGSGTYNAQGYELDFNNMLAHRGDAAAGAGLASPIAYGFSVTGAGSFRSTAAFLISGPGTGIWNRGIVIANTSVVQASFQDLSNATTSLEVFGSHTYGFDAQDASFSAGPIRIGNSAFMLARNAANSADLRLIGLDNANNLNLGGSGLAATLVYTQFLPNVDNSFILGGPSNRWSTVYAGTGTINTSDATEKVIRGAPNTAELAAWATVEPKVFTFIDGTRSHVGYVAQEVAAALTAQGLKPADYGFWCKDDWTDSQGVARTRQGLRYEECAVMEAALTRQKIADLTARIAALEARK